MKYEKFDIELALAGEPVITRSGAKAYIRHKEEDIKLKHPLMGFVLGEPSNGEFWTLCGAYYSNGYEYDQDIIGMYPKEPLTMPDSFWDMLTPKAVAIAKGGSESWYVYEGAIPIFNEFLIWESLHASRVHPLAAFNPDIFPNCKPEDSLIIRPKEK